MKLKGGGSHNVLINKICGFGKDADLISINGYQLIQMRSKWTYCFLFLDKNSFVTK